MESVSDSIYAATKRTLARRALVNLCHSICTRMSAGFPEDRDLLTCCRNKFDLQLSI